MNSDFFSGGFNWFTGVIEDINDPEEMGRYRVRCFGYHTDDKALIPIESLPWAHVMMPVTSASMTGIGQSATGLLQGSWVVGFFRDGANAQDPLIMGSIPSMSAKPSDKEKGFNDSSGLYPLANYVAGGEVDTPRPARSEYSTSLPYTAKEDLRQLDIETAVPPRVTSIAPDKDDAYYTRGTWQNHELEDIISPIYPDNHVEQTASGHILEVDDTPFYERLSNYHTSGTYEEVVANGDKTVTVVGNEFEVTFKNKNMYVKGSVNLTIDGDMKTLVKGNYHLEVEGDKTEYIKGNSLEKIGLNKLIEIDEEYSANIAKNYTTRIGGNEIRDVVKDSTTNIIGNYGETINGNYTHYVQGSESLTTIGDLNIVTASKYTCVSDDTFKLDSNMDMDIDASLNIDIDGDNIFLN